MVKLIEADELNIILPAQIENEYFRNRENKIKKAIDHIKNLKIDFKLPRIVDAYEEKKDLMKIFKEYSSKKELLIDKIEKDAEGFKLKADNLIQNIFANAEKIKLTDEIRNKAQKRFDLWNPPWKDKSYGDAVIRESLLNYKFDEDVYFVSIDGDFSCSLKPKNLDNFLKKERGNKSWFLHKTGNIFYYNELNDFFEFQFPNLKINEEYFKNKYIEKLENSKSFDQSRLFLNRLQKYENFSSDQLNRIVDASIHNKQIYRAHPYSPELIGQVLYKIIEWKEKYIDADVLKVFNNIYTENTEIDEDTLPF